MARSGRPTIRRNNNSISRDIAVLLRLRKALENDTRLSPETVIVIRETIDRLIALLENLDLAA